MKIVEDRGNEISQVTLRECPSCNFLCGLFLFLQQFLVLAFATLLSRQYCM